MCSHQSMDRARNEEIQWIETVVLHIDINSNRYKCLAGLLDIYGNCYRSYGCLTRKTGNYYSRFALTVYCLARESSGRYLWIAATSQTPVKSMDSEYNAWLPRKQLKHILHYRKFSTLVWIVLLDIDRHLGQQRNHSVVREHVREILKLCILHITHLMDFLLL